MEMKRNMNSHWDIECVIISAPVSQCVKLIYRANFDTENIRTTDADHGAFDFVH